MNTLDWTKQFISKLLYITHGQWIYRNISCHHTKLGLLKELERSTNIRWSLGGSRGKQVSPGDWLQGHLGGIYYGVCASW
jgi:hypothetical protein